MTTLTGMDMYDSTNPANIPSNAQYVGGYGDGAWNWMATHPELFPSAHKFKFVVFASDDGDCLDVERGDATPAQAPGWAARQRAQGKQPVVYCSALGAYGWQAVQDAFNAQHVPHPYYFVATYNGTRALPVLNGITAIAHQYTDVGPYDLSSLSDTFIELVGGTVTTPGDFIAALIAFRDGNGRNLFDMGAQSVATGFTNQATLANVATALNTEAAAVHQTDLDVKTADADVKAAQTDIDTHLGGILNAVLALPAPNTNVAPTDAQMATLAQTLAAAYPNYTVNITKS